MDTVVVSSSLSVKLFLVRVKQGLQVTINLVFGVIDERERFKLLSFLFESILWGVFLLLRLLLICVIILSIKSFQHDNNCID